MTSDTEKEIDEIVERRFKEMWSKRLDIQASLKLAVLDGYKAGMEAAKKIYTS